MSLKVAIIGDRFMRPDYFEAGLERIWPDRSRLPQLLTSLAR